MEKKERQLEFDYFYLEAFPLQMRPTYYTQIAFPTFSNGI